MARDKNHVLRFASAERVDLFIPDVVRRSSGLIEVRGGAHCAKRRPNGLDYYIPEELWVVEPVRLDAARSVVSDIERMISACLGDDEFTLARARDAVNVAMVEEMQRVMKGAQRLDQWLESGREL